MSPGPIKPNKDAYPEKIPGVFGSLGHHTTSVRYVQTALPLRELDRLRLIMEIDGSEKWGVRELFQRNVDDKRVNDKIVPYFTHQRKRKFFNPLTVAIMPFEKEKVLTKFSEKKYEEIIEEREHDIIEAKKYYKVSIDTENPEYTLLEYNKENVRLVAIDGQHRLSALKNVYATKEDVDEATHGYSDWRIPVVFILIEPQPRSFNYLDSVREVFVTINSNAKRPSRAQLILLDDYSINHICVQEFVNYCQDKKSKVPLVFFDWKASEKKQVLKEQKGRLISWSPWPPANFKTRYPAFPLVTTVLILLILWWISNLNN